MSGEIIRKASAELDLLRSRHDAARFPPLCRSLLRSIPGNHACADCNAPNPEWASVTYGCLICMRCSGRHRSYGVQTSFVRSIDMDHWTSEQVLTMLEGGNDQLQAFFERHHMGRNSEMAGKRYHTKAALFYRTHLSKHVKAVAKQGSYQGREESRKKYQKEAQKSAELCGNNNTGNTSATTEATKGLVSVQRKAIRAQ